MLHSVDYQQKHITQNAASVKMTNTNQDVSMIIVCVTCYYTVATINIRPMFHMKLFSEICLTMKMLFD